MAADTFISRETPGIDAPAANSAAVTPTTSAVILATIPTAIHCNADGNLYCWLKGDDPTGNPRKFVLKAGQCYPYRVAKISATDDGTYPTTATDLVAVWG